MKTKSIVVVSMVILSVFAIHSMAATKNGNALSFVGKQWQMKSILTNPPYLDIDGDGKKDAEVINSLKAEARKKIIIFKENGLVEERHFSESGEMSIIKNGSWKKSADSDTFTWFLPGGNILKGKTQNNDLILEFSDSNLEIRYVLSSVEI